MTEFHGKDFKFGRARAKLSSISPYCHNGVKVVQALCEICGSVQGFTLGDNCGFPDTGYWTECRACQSWTTFYRIHEGHIVRANDREQDEIIKHWSEAFDAGLRTAADLVRGNDSIRSSWGGSDQVANVILSMRKTP